MSECEHYNFIPDSRGFVVCEGCNQQWSRSDFIALMNGKLTEEQHRILHDQPNKICMECLQPFTADTLEDVTDADVFDPYCCKWVKCYLHEKCADEMKVLTFSVREEYPD